MSEHASLADALVAARAAARPCPVGALIDRLPAAEAEVLVAALADTALSAMQIHRALRMMGLRAGYDAVKLHRRNECRCEHR